MLREKLRNVLVIALAGGVVLVDSASYILSMVSDLILVCLLVTVVYAIKPKA